MDAASSTPPTAKAKAEHFEIEGLPKMPLAFQATVWVCLVFAVLIGYAGSLRIASQPMGLEEVSPKFFALDNKFIILEDPRLRVPSRQMAPDGSSTQISYENWSHTLKHNV